MPSDVELIGIYFITEVGQTVSEINYKLLGKFLDK